ncbi:MAG: prefoldin subunit alpha [Nitrososphaerota archaeon]|nr:prefoldin subunit alpha [Nitrososphaerota archaeon]MDG6962497.1 prefoldin subunit alpha [Nitrososphaerota archaeon]MDG6966186.1 prefoldin subunit alpha [Nitrososphaerota archaeon]MDG6977621.1 prefoldin subunit alpha [Nitrososphaerota archaeon]MDG7006436.1 prefoldin subunit alpha [Nitrososphaerota archaeon]
MSSEEERMNQLIVESRMLEATYNELTSRQSMLERMLIESRASLDTLRGIGTAVTDEVLVPVGAGVLLRASPPKADKVLVSVGASVVLEKKKEDAEKMLEARSKDIEENIVTILSQRNQIAQRLEADRRTLQAYIDRQELEQQQRPGQSG